MKKIVSLIVVCSLLVLTAGTPLSFLGMVNEYKAHAAKSKEAKSKEVKVWSGEIDISWYTGDKDSYDIYTAEELAGINKLVFGGIESFEGITINLRNDIKLNDTKDWKKWGEKPPKNIWAPIGDKEALEKRPFKGCFNGNGHTISGVYVDRTERSWWSSSPYHGGFFGFIEGAIIENLKFKYSYTSASGHAGTVVALSQNSYLIDVCVEKCIVKAEECAGGLVGVSLSVDDYSAAVAFVLPVLLTGVMFNPLLFIDLDGELKGYAATCLYNCIANNVKLIGINAGGLVGGGGSYAGDCIGVANSYAANITFDHTGEAGCLVARPCEENEFVEIKNSYRYNCKNAKKDSKIRFVDAESVAKVSEKTLHSKKFAEKLGDQFKYVKGKAPKCKMKFKNK